MAERPSEAAYRELARLHEKKLFGKSERGEADRCLELIRTYWREWVGPVAALFPKKYVPTYAYGLLTSATLDVQTDADRKLAQAPVLDSLTALTCKRADLVV